MPDLRIFKPSKTATQSARRNTDRWMVQFERDAPQVHDPLTGWVGSADTRTQVRLSFETQEAAVAFAERNGLTYEIEAPRERVIRPKSYADNFRS